MGFFSPPSHRVRRSGTLRLHEARANAAQAVRVSVRLMACAYAKNSVRLGVCLASSGPGGILGAKPSHEALKRAFLPAIGKSNAVTLLIADGFSCREQIAQATGRHAVHLAQVIQQALSEEHEKPRAR